MHRRAVLAGLATAASGCLGSPDSPGSGDTPPPTATASATPLTVPENGSSGSSPTVTPPTSPFPRRVAVAAIDDAPLREAFDVAAGVSVPDGDVVAGETATVAVALRTTDGTARSLTYQQQECSRNEFRASNGEFGLLPFPADGEWTVEDTDCPVAEHSIDCGIPVVEEAVEVPAGGTLTWRYDVLVPPGNLDRGGCVVPREYRFDRQFTDGGATAALSFVLSVTEP